MKNQIVSLLALVLVSPSAFATKGNISKIFDGKIAYCTEYNHAGNRGYRPDGLGAKNDEASAMSVTFILQNLKCEERGDKAEWAYNSRPGESIEGRDLNNKPMLIKLSNREAVLVRGDASILSVIPLEEVAQQPLDFGFSLEQLLNRDEMSALDSGKVLETRATFFIRSQVTVQTHTGENVQLGLRSGGAYAILLTLKKADGGQIQVLNTRFK